MIDFDDLLFADDGEYVYVYPTGLRLTYQQALFFASQLVGHAAAVDPRVNQPVIVNNDHEDDAA